jgi:hypothetical protein
MRQLLCRAAHAISASGQRTLLHIDLVSLPAAVALELELALMRGVDDRLGATETYGRA